MATYIVGDIHGCFEEFARLLETIDFDGRRDRLWHTGDLVNGGPLSKATLQWFYDHEDVATTVLGNHDLHLLAVAHGVRSPSERDTFDDILEDSQGPALIDWLRRQPLMVCQGRRVLVHAGLFPQWSVDDALARAREIEELLASTEPEQVLAVMYGNRPARLRDVSTTEGRWRLTINTMTRMRVLREDGALDFGYKATYEKIPSGRRAWFDAPDPAWRGHRIHCGHWSALGFRQSADVVSLDTGCRWGRALSAFRVDDEAVFSVPSAVGAESH